MSAHTVNLQRSDGTLLEGLTRGSASAAIVAGAFRAAADIVDLVAVTAGGGARALSTHGYLVFASLELVFGVLVVWGLLGLFEHVDSIDGKQRRGRVVLAGFGLAMFGALMGVGNSWAATFVAPIAAAEAPNLSFVATTGRAPGLLQFAVMLGYVPSSLACLCSRPRPCGAGLSQGGSRRCWSLLWWPTSPFRRCRAACRRSSLDCFWEWRSRPSAATSSVHGCGVPLRRHSDSWTVTVEHCAGGVADALARDAGASRWSAPYRLRARLANLV